MSKIRDFAIGRVLTAPSPATTGTTVVLESGQGADMPTTLPFKAVAFAPTAVIDKYNSEKILVTARTGDTLTITRAQGETGAQSIEAGWYIANSIFVEDVLAAGNSMISDETPAGSVNGSNTAFTTANPYVGSSLEVYVNGLRQARTTHVTETNPSAGTFTLDVAPTTGDIVRVNYLHALNVSGNADTVDGLHADTLSPAGVVLPYAGINAPSGWLFCYGQEVSQTDYPALYTALGATYGAASAGMFKLPDLRGRVIAGQDDMGGTSANRLTGLTGGVDGDTLGGAGGAETAVNTLSDAGQAKVSAGGSGISTDMVSVPSWTRDSFSTASGSASSAALTTAAGLIGTTDAGNNVQPTIILNYIIRAI